MSETPRSPRQNREGDPCPPWCTVDHEKYESHVGGGGRIDGIWTRAIRSRGVSEVGVCASLPDPKVTWPSLNLDLHEAKHLAVIVELLAGATPDQHRELAAAIRQAAAEIAGDGDGRPS
jgi:hypothetical protein